MTIAHRFIYHNTGKLHVLEHNSPHFNHTKLRQVAIHADGDCCEMLTNGNRLLYAYIALTIL